MMEINRINENEQYEIAKEWLTNNGVFKSYFIEARSVYKVEFTTDEETTVLEGQDLILLTIQLYNEFKN